MYFHQFIEFILNYKYFLIFITTIIEGPIVMISSGIMLHSHIVAFWPVYLTLIAGDLAGDIFWYSLGYHLGENTLEKYGHFIGITKEKLETTKKIFRNHEIKILFISKITMGFGLALAVLVTAGLSKMSFKKYFSVNFLGQFVWTGFLLYIGYSFGNLYNKIDKSLKVVSLVAFIFVIFLIIRGVNSYFKKRNLTNK